MGYDLHITRKDFWAYPGEEIPLEEWRAAVAADPELTWVPDKGPNVAAWSGPSKNPEPWLEWYFGDVFAKNPDAPLIDKMVAIARILKARVQGLDGEFYDGSEAPLPADPPSLGDRIAAWFNRARGA